ncbi:MAG: antibiotic biosynthesis monooxygenase [Flavobacteriaceae bacterium]
MKHILFCLSLFLLVGCNSVTNKDYEANLVLAKKWVSSFETNNVELWKEVVSEDLVDVAPLYGMGQVDYQTSLNIANFYVNNYEEVEFQNPVWLPGVDTLTMKPDGSVRAYGTWTGKSKSTGRTFSVTSYHNFDFKEGKIVSTGEYFDATGMVNAVGPVQRNVVVATAKVKPQNLKKFQELMDSENGLSVTRNYDGCLHLESFYHKESSTYFIMEYWESFEKYEAYLDWRFNKDPSKFTNKVWPYVVGGQKGFSAYYNNTDYKFY